MDVNMKLASLLKQLRIEQKLSSITVAKDLGVAEPTISRYETGRIKPPLEMLCKLLVYYKVPLTLEPGETIRTRSAVIDIRPSELVDSTLAESELAG